MQSNEAYRSFVIVNPASAAGATGRRWDRIASLLRSSLGPFEHRMTAAPGEASLLARQALIAGFEMIVAVGGDGTLHEVVNGFFEGYRPVARNAVLGVVAVGTGSDFGRTIEQESLESACQKLVGRNTRTIDVGLASFTGNDGTPRTEIFINVASCGCSGVVARLVSPRLKSLSGSLAFWLATIRALSVYRDQTVTLKFDDQTPRSLPITNCAFANGRYFGAGMQVAPAAELDDGKFEVTLWSGFGVLDFVRLRGAIRDGSHVKVKGTEVLRTKSATVSSSSEVWLELDGESVGKLPARVEILPAAVRLKI